ncbi:restriction endonuclease subunit S [Fluviicola sp.]|uniref:restriction endonuclease subunit S n=1 Tax=Fluviicola sp. TaxID=1917219 RepID=UPI0028351705|nr:restriction endonuclease subunit S [Fluviicola sp.]MDR0802763.1 restriction endonuclease subunit S [Fluviicola sp.]
MIRHIYDITSIQTGVFAKPADTGDIVYLQAKHFDENGQLAAKLHADLSTSGISNKHILKYGDILFAAKGTKNFATAYEKHNLPAVASTSFFVLRLTDKNVLPEYLAWFLNHPNTLTLLKAQAIGTSIPSISKQVLESLEIKIPNVETQQIILKIANLRKQEKKLNQQIEFLTDKKIQQQIINAIK